MIITEACVACGECLQFCPVLAIEIKENQAVIREEDCVECGNCLRTASCPVNAIERNELTWPRTIRHILSDPQSLYAETGVTGRGTEEMKTNCVTGRFVPGELGIAIDVGRPNMGVKISEIEKITQALAALGLTFEKDNPITALLKDNQGNIAEEVKNERILSGVVECKVKEEEIDLALARIEEVAGELDTVFSLGIIAPVYSNGEIPVWDKLTANGWDIRPNGKTNIGLGRK